MHIAFKLADLITRILCARSVGTLIPDRLVLKIRLRR